MNTLHHALKLLRCPGLGPVGCKRLLLACDNPAGVFNASDSILTSAGLNSDQIAALRALDEDDIAADLNWAARTGNHIITTDDPRYPPKLTELNDAPPVLYVTGDLEVLQTPQLAMVGSRNPSPGGKENAERFAQELASRGLTITSGLAAGIDAASHTGALSAGGLSIAVTGTGLDRVYPAANRALAHRLAEHGAIVSEFPIGSPPSPSHFPRRNRIISALSHGVLVVEATVRSGSLITARLATEQGREVLAIPGSIHNPMSRGCHALIRQGAKLVETSDDVLEELGPLLGDYRADAPVKAHANTPLESTPTNGEDADYKRLFESLGHDPVAIDTLVERTGFDSASLSSMLLMLELTGKVHNVGGGRYALRN